MSIEVFECRDGRVEVCVGDDANAEDVVEIQGRLRGFEPCRSGAVCGRCGRPFQRWDVHETRDGRAELVCSRCFGSGGSFLLGTRVTL
jgi:hypothetical protein